MDLLQDLLAALGVVLNGLPQGLLALTYGFASVPTALGFLVGGIACIALSSVAPISFQAETITLAGTMGKDIKERLSMIMYAGIIMVILGFTGALSSIVDFAGDVIINAMMAGVGIMLAKVALEMCKANKIVGTVSLASAVIVYFFLGNNLVYTIVLSVVLSTIAARIAKQPLADIADEKAARFRFCKPGFNYNIVRGALALCCLTIGGNIAFGSITGSIAGTTANIDHLTVYSGLADIVSSMFGGGPVEAIISATASAPNPIWSAVIMMAIMAIILFCGLLPKIGKYVPNQSIAGFLFILGAVVTVGTNGAAAFAGSGAGDGILAGVTMGVTAAADPFVGLISGIILKLLFSVGIGL